MKEKIRSIDEPFEVSADAEDIEKERLRITKMNSMPDKHLLHMARQKN